MAGLGQEPGAGPARGRATRVTVAVFGVVAASAGVEHGVGEIAQGRVRPESPLIASWPDTPAFDVVGGEPAFTLVPDLLVSDLLRRLGDTWPWMLGVAVILWLCLMPGTVLLSQAVTFDFARLMPVVMLAAFAGLALALVVSRAYDTGHVDDTGCVDDTGQR